jgi:hypothetical protein
MNDYATRPTPTWDTLGITNAPRYLIAPPTMSTRRL